VQQAAKGISFVSTLWQAQADLPGPVIGNDCPNE
jgi:hypothetical protein